MTTAFNGLYMNDGSSGFTSLDGSAVAASLMQSHDGCFGDYDGDGDLDIFIVSSFPGAPKEFYVNDGSGTYEFAVWGSFSTTIFDGYGVLAADLDANGMLDVVTFNVGTAGSNLAAGTAIEQFMVNRYPVRNLHFPQMSAINAALAMKKKTLTQSTTICGIALSSYNWTGYDDTSGGWPNAAKRWHTGLGGIDALQYTQGSFIGDADMYLALNSVVPNSVVADIDGDGDLDIIVSTQSSPNSAGMVNVAVPYSVVMMNDGAGRFSEHATATDLVGVVGLFDIDADGDLDLIDACLRVYVNDGTGAFSTSNVAQTLWGGDLSSRPTTSQITSQTGVTTSTWTWAGAYVLDDLDGDGDVDLLGGGAAGLNLYKQESGMVFASAVNADATGNGGNGFLNGYYIFNLALGDFDGDGDADVVILGLHIASYQSSTAGNNVLMILGNGGSGTFDVASTVLSNAVLNEFATSSYGAGTLRQQNLAVADLNNDNKLDIVTAQASNPILFGDGAGAFGTASGNAGSVSPNAAGSPTYSGQITCTAATATYTSNSPCTGAWLPADFDNDGDIDLLFTRPFTQDLMFESVSGTLKDTPRPVGSATNSYSEALTVNIGLTAGDIDRDGDLDLLLTRMGSVELHVSSYCPTTGRADTGACFTCPHFAVRAYMADRCEECPEHTATGGTSTCQVCPAGFDRTLNTHACTICAAGTAGGLGRACSTCPAGEAAASLGLSSCTRCLAGSYASTSGSTTCATCAVGSYQPDRGQAACITCGAGSYADTTTTCNKCPVGTFNPTSGQTACAACPVGFFCEQGAIEPLPCAAGRYGSSTGRIDDQCSGACAAGHYCPANSTSSTQIPCPAGTYSARLGRGFVEQCTPCSLGGFCGVAAVEPTMCEDLIPSSYTTDTYKTSIDDCMCVNQHYMRYNPVNNTRACISCPGGFDCNGFGTRLESVMLLEGYWRQSNLSEAPHVKRCFNSPACIRSQNMTEQGSLCRTGHVGPYCGVCEPNWFGGTDSKPCKPCVGSISLAYLPMAVLLLFLLLLLVAFVRGGEETLDLAAGLAESAHEGNVSGAAARVLKAELRKRATKAYMNEVDKSAKEVSERRSWGEACSPSGLKASVLVFSAKASTLWSKFQVKVKIIISLVQVINGLGAVFSIPYPPLYDTIMNDVGGAVQIELAQLMPLDCLYPMDFYGKLLLRTILPLVLYTIMFTSSIAFHKCGKPWQSDALIDGIFFIMFLVYPSTAAKLFSVFVCEPLEDGSGRMRVDFSIECRDTQGQITPLYFSMLLYTGVMMVIYVIGTPATYAYLFFVKFKKEMLALQAQEVADAHIEELQKNPHLNHEEKLALEHMGLMERVDATAVLPGYMRRLTSGCMFRMGPNPSLSLLCL